MCKYKVLQEYLHITFVCSSHSLVFIYNDLDLLNTKHLKEFDSPLFLWFLFSKQNDFFFFQEYYKSSLVSTSTCSNQTLSLLRFAFPFQWTWQNFMAKNMSPLASTLKNLSIVCWSWPAATTGPSQHTQDKIHLCTNANLGVTNTSWHGLGLVIQNRGTK